jgi:hypothetical protein
VQLNDDDGALAADTQEGLDAALYAIFGANNGDLALDSNLLPDIPAGAAAELPCDAWRCAIGACCQIACGQENGRIGRLLHCACYHHPPAPRLRCAHPLFVSACAFVYPKWGLRVQQSPIASVV